MTTTTSQIFSTSKNGNACIFYPNNMATRLDVSNGEAEHVTRTRAFLSSNNDAANELPPPTLASLVALFLREAVQIPAPKPSQLLFAVIRTVINPQQPPQLFLLIHSEMQLPVAKVKDWALWSHMRTQWASEDGCMFLYDLQPLEDSQPSAVRAFFDTMVVATLRMCTKSMHERARLLAFCVCDHDGSSETCCGFNVPVHPLVPYALLYQTYLLHVYTTETPPPFLRPTVCVVNEEGAPLGVVQLALCISTMHVYCVATRAALNELGGLKPEAGITLRTIQCMLTKSALKQTRLFSQSSEMLQSADTARHWMVQFANEYYDMLLSNPGHVGNRKESHNELLARLKKGHGVVPPVCLAACILFANEIINKLKTETGGVRDIVETVRSANFATQALQMRSTTPLCFHVLLCDVSHAAVPLNWQVGEMHLNPQESFENLLLVGLWYECICTLLDAARMLEYDVEEKLRHFAVGVVFGQADTPRAMLRIGHSGNAYFFFNPLRLNVARGNGQPGTQVYATLQTTTYTARQRDLCLFYFLSLAASLVADVVDPHDTQTFMTCTLAYVRSHQETRLRQTYLNIQKQLRTVRQALQRELKYIKSTMHAPPSLQQSMRKEEPPVLCGSFFVPFTIHTSNNNTQSVLPVYMPDDYVSKPLPFLPPSSATVLEEDPLANMLAAFDTDSLKQFDTYF